MTFMARFHAWRSRRWNKKHPGNTITVDIRMDASGMTNQLDLEVIRLKQKEARWVAECLATGKQIDDQARLVRNVRTLADNYAARARDLPDPPARWADVESDVRALVDEQKNPDRGDRHV